MVLLLLLGILPPGDITEDRVAVIEVNHLYDDAGRAIYDQAIFWQWYSDGHHVRAWRLVNTSMPPPTRRPGSRAWRMTWRDGDRLRVVEGQSLRETWTQYDPEIDDRLVLPKESRSELSGDKLTIVPGAAQ